MGYSSDTSVGSCMHVYWKYPKNYVAGPDVMKISAGQFSGEPASFIVGTLGSDKDVGGQYHSYGCWWIGIGVWHSGSIGYIISVGSSG